MDVNYLLMKSKIKQGKEAYKFDKGNMVHLNNFVKKKKQVVVEAKTNNQQLNIGYLFSKSIER